jgi:AraC family transcriptional regulator
MAYQRTHCFSSDLLRIETAVPQAAWQDGWSAEYASSELKIVLPQTGHFCMRFGSRTLLFDACTALALPPARGYRIRHAQRQQARMLVMTVCDGEAAFELALHDGAIAVTPPVQWQLLRFCRAAGAGEMQVLEAEERSVHLLDLLLRRRCAPQRPACVAPEVERARECLAAAPEKVSSLAWLAQQAGCSVFHLARQFKRVTGSSVHRYQSNLRLCAALHRLAQGAPDLTMLAMDCGFSSHSHFSAAFKRAFGTTPQHSRALLYGGRARIR